VESVGQLVGMPEVSHIFERVAPVLIARNETGLRPVVHEERIFNSGRVVPILYNLSLSVRMPTRIPESRNENLMRRRDSVEGKIAPMGYNNTFFRHLIYQKTGVVVCLQAEVRLEGPAQPRAVKENVSYLIYITLIDLIREGTYRTAFFREKKNIYPFISFFYTCETNMKPNF
jgi:hypothetical protein